MHCCRRWVHPAACLLFAAKEHPCVAGQGTDGSGRSWVRCPAAGGEDAAHLAHRGAQAPGDLDGVVVHEKGCDLLPVVARRDPDGGDGGKPRLLGTGETGLHLQLLAAAPSPAEPRSLPRECITAGGTKSCPDTSPPAWVRVLMLSLQFGGGPAPHPPPPSRRAPAPGRAAPGTAGCSWPDGVPMSSPDPVGRGEGEGPGTHRSPEPHQHCWCPPACLASLTSSASMAKPSRRLKKLLMGAVWWYLQKPRGTRMGSARPAAEQCSSVR